MSVCFFFGKFFASKKSNASTEALVWRTRRGCFTQWEESPWEARRWIGRLLLCLKPSTNLKFSWHEFSLIVLFHDLFSRCYVLLIRDRSPLESTGAKEEYVSWFVILIFFLCLLSVWFFSFTSINYICCYFLFNVDRILNLHGLSISLFSHLILRHFLQDKLCGFRSTQEYWGWFELFTMSSYLRMEKWNIVLCYNLDCCFIYSSYREKNSCLQLLRRIKSA